jgi:phosphopantetheinyl transferase (holo-ACP synthase)
MGRSLSSSYCSLSLTNPSGKPEISLPPSLRQIEKRIHVSLSHSSSHVVAVAILSNE